MVLCAFIFDPPGTVSAIVEAVYVDPGETWECGDSLGHCHVGLASGADLRYLRHDSRSSRCLKELPPDALNSDEARNNKPRGVRVLTFVFTELPLLSHGLQAPRLLRE